MGRQTRPLEAPASGRLDAAGGRGGRGTNLGQASPQAGHDAGGFEAGERAVRNRDRFDPVREKRYREGDHGYERQWGSRDDYQREYRAAFQRGYETGYRGYRR